MSRGPGRVQRFILAYLEQHTAARLVGVIEAWVSEVNPQTEDQEEYARLSAYRAALRLYRTGSIGRNWPPKYRRPDVTLYRRFPPLAVPSEPQVSADPSNT